VGVVNICNSYWLLGLVRITNRTVVCIYTMEATGLTLAKQRL